MEEMQQAPQEQGPDEAAIVDQIGALLGQLPPEKQQMLLAQLGQMLQGQGGVASPEQGGAEAQPVGM